ncbi:MAG: hypothetical protein ACM3ON_00420 [Chloroflexota bacterium]
MLFFTMFFWRWRKTSSPHEAALWEKVKELIVEIETAKREAEKKLKILETSAAERCQELEGRLKMLEERMWQLNRSLTSTDPDKRFN